MSVVTNHQLFSHTYLAQLQADSSHDEAAAPFALGGPVQALTRVPYSGDLQTT